MIPPQPRPAKLERMFVTTLEGGAGDIEAPDVESSAGCSLCTVFRRQISSESVLPVRKLDSKASGLRVREDRVQGALHFSAGSSTIDRDDLDRKLHLPIDLDCELIP